MLARIEAGGELIDQAAAASLKEQKLARGSVKLKLTKAGIARLKKLREPPPEPAPPKKASRKKSKKPDLFDQTGAVDCRVCSEGNGLCAECIAAADHVVTEQIIREWDDLAAPPRELVATCTCGFECRVEFVEEDGGANLQQPVLNAAIKAHLQNVVTEAKAAAASSDTGDIPESIRRGADGLAPFQRARSEAAE
jgi:hypothetical protein